MNVNEPVGKVTVNGIPYSIYEERDGDDVYSNREGESRLGLCDYVDQYIVLHEDMSVPRKRQVLAHELAHAYIDCNGWAAAGETFDVEQLCEFVGCYGQQIAKTVDAVYPLGY